MMHSAEVAPRFLLKLFLMNALLKLGIYIIQQKAKIWICMRTHTHPLSLGKVWDVKYPGQSKCFELWIDM